jgi:hypothetical protein
MTPTVETYRLSPRIVLAPGDSFRVAGGPYYRLADGRRVPMAARGTFRLVEVVRERSRVYLLGYGREGSGLVLNLVYNPQGPSLPPPRLKPP